jgi:hypothetical protein
MTNHQWKLIQDDILDRRGIKWEWQQIDPDVKKEIRKAWEAILKPVKRGTRGSSN